MGKSSRKIKRLPAQGESDTPGPGVRGGVPGAPASKSGDGPADAVGTSGSAGAIIERDRKEREIWERNKGKNPKDWEIPPEIRQRGGGELFGDALREYGIAVSAMGGKLESEDEDDEGRVREVYNWTMDRTRRHFYHVMVVLLEFYRRYRRLKKDFLDMEEILEKKQEEEDNNPGEEKEVVERGTSPSPPWEDFPGRREDIEKEERGIQTEERMGEEERREEERIREEQEKMVIDTPVDYSPILKTILFKMERIEEKVERLEERASSRPTSSRESAEEDKCSSPLPQQDRGWRRALLKKSKGKEKEEELPKMRRKEEKKREKSPIDPPKGSPKGTQKGAPRPPS